MDTKIFSQNATAFILGAALVLSTIIGSWVFYDSRSTNSLSVTGSAKQQITSNHVRWLSSFTRTVSASELKSGYSLMASDLAIVQAFFKSKGLDESKITISPVTMYEQYKQNSGDPTMYNLRQNIEIQSDDVAGITTIAKSATDLISRGVIFNSDNIEYSYTKLAELRVSLLGSALKDAQARAGELARTTGKSVGSLQSASSGVVQVLPVNSVDISDYGTYDTSSIEKDVMVTVKAAFTLR